MMNTAPAQSASPGPAKKRRAVKITAWAVARKRKSFFRPLWSAMAPNTGMRIATVTAEMFTARVQ